MHIRMVLRLVAYVIVAMGLSLGLCYGLAHALGDPKPCHYGFGVSAAGVAAVGLLLWLATRGPPAELTRRDGYGVVTFGWIAAALAGAFPYVLSGAIPSYPAAVFETMSGLTTTGASVIAVVEPMPRSVLFWRALTHFYGGMGVLILVVAVLPLIGTGGMQLFRAEMPGPTKDRLTPRIATTAKLLWAVYVGLVVIEMLLLRLGGMSWFDAVCHSFATIATGGFSTRTASIGHYHSPFIEIVVTVFMFLAGANFALHFRALRGEFRPFLRDSEFKFYILTVSFSSLFIAAHLMASEFYRDFGAALRTSAFAVVSMVTTTGFATDDFDRWPGVVRLLLVLLMFIGGCAGSTAGAMKHVRVLVALKAVAREIKTWVRPKAIIQVKLDGAALESSAVANIVAFVIIYLGVFAGASFLMAFYFPNDLVSAATSVAATLGNVGPGLNAVGPTMNYSQIPGSGLTILTLCMLLGRLELFTVLALFLPSFWKK